MRSVRLCVCKRYRYTKRTDEKYEALAVYKYYINANFLDTSVTLRTVQGDDV